MQDLRAVQQTERAVAIRKHIKTERARLSDAAVFQFKKFPDIEEFVNLFPLAVALHRRPILVILGGTSFGKSLLAADVLNRITKFLGLEAYIKITIDGN